MKIIRGFFFLYALSCALGCTDDATGTNGHDLSIAGEVVVNEVFASGSSTKDPDWAELRNLSASAIDLSGYKIRDKKTDDAYSLPDGTSIPGGGYLIVYCDDQSDGGVAGGLHVPWKLNSGKGDELHLESALGVDLDATTFGGDIPSDKSWGRLPDGTGSFVPMTPTRGASNL